MISRYTDFEQYIDLEGKFSIQYKLDEGINIYDSSSKDSDYYPILLRIPHTDFIVKDILKIILSVSTVPALNKLISERISLPLLGRELLMFAGKENEGDSIYYDGFDEKKSFMSYLGVDDPIKVKLTIVDTSTSGSDFKDTAGDIVYGIWEINTNKIDTSFIFRTILQTKVCFSDLAVNTINKGSYFVKLKVEEV